MSLSEEPEVNRSVTYQIYFYYTSISSIISTSHALASVIEYRYRLLHGLCSCILRIKQDKRNIDLSDNMAAHNLAQAPNINDVKVTC